MCPYRGCGTIATDRQEDALQEDCGQWKRIDCKGCGKAYSARAYTVVEYETEILEDDKS